MFGRALAKLPKVTGRCVTSEVFRRINASYLYTTASVKRRVFVYGGTLVDRIDFEELSLQGIDPSLGPRIGQLRRVDSEKDDSLMQVS